MLGGRSYSCQRCGRCIRGEMYYSGGLTCTCLQNGTKAAQNEVAGQAKADELRLVSRLECNFVQLITYPRDNYSFITTPSHFNEVPVSRLGE